MAGTVGGRESNKVSYEAQRREVGKCVLGLRRAPCLTGRAYLTRWAAVTLGMHLLEVSA